MNVTALARKLKIPTSELLDKLPQMGFDIGAKAIKIDDKLVDKIIESFEEERKKEQFQKRQEKIKEIKLDKEGSVREKETVILPETIVVNDLAKKLNTSLAKVMSELMKNGIVISLNEKIDYETAAIISEDLGYQTEKQSTDEQDIGCQTEQQQIKELIKNEKGDLPIKPPVVVVMGHVDHGKTKLLDAIRRTNVIDQESGGITQHIGAYQVEDKGRAITFLDTPGHEAFKSMRSRGSQVADLAIVVVAADEGLKPQTIESFEMVQKENIPFIVAINKIDKENADIDKVKKELSEINVVPEDWGGKTICVPISAKKEEGIKDLLEMVYLVADLTQLKANPDRPAIGTIIESHVDKGEGPVATVLISCGTLTIGDFVVIGQVAGKIRAMKDFTGKAVRQAPPSMPVRILGLKTVPQVGDILKVITDKKIIKQKLKDKQYIMVKKTTGHKRKDEPEESRQIVLPIILKTDVLGSQEAIIEAFNKLNSASEAEVKVIKKGLGIISEVDVLDAFAEKAILIGFHVKVKPAVEKLAKEKAVEIKTYEIIYKIIEDLEEKIKELTKPEMVRVELGKIQVLKIFKDQKEEKIIGGKVLAGKIINNTKVKIIRQDEVLGFGDLVQLQTNRQDASEVIIGQECGLKIKTKISIHEGDLLEIYEEKI